MYVLLISIYQDITTDIIRYKREKKNTFEYNRLFFIVNYNVIIVNTFS